MKLARWLLPIVSLVIVLVITWWDTGGVRSGPGPLHSAHARIEALAQGSNCEACHRAGAGIDPAGCNHCHAAIEKQAASGIGLHGRLPAADLARCGSCHGEHHGDAAPLIAAHAFSRIGVADMAAYDHRDVTFTLTGAHKPLQCDRCHVHANEVEPPQDGRFVGLSQKCTSCHEDQHKGAYGADCASCHGQEEKWKNVPKFPHAEFPLKDAHGKVECKACHEDGTEHSVNALRTTPLTVRACAVCHADPHGSGTLEVKALRLGKTSDCSRCHASTAWAEARPTVEKHAEFGFPLAAAHAKATCVACHGDAKQASRWPGRAPQLAECGACHEHPHRAELMSESTKVVGPANGCAGCHKDTDKDFRGGAMPPALHAATGFPLVVPHAEVACAACHKGEDKKARFPGRMADDCRACHQDVHRGQFDLDTRYRQCTACHLTTTFHPAQFGVVAHAATAFPLTGAHDAVGCVQCHKDVKDGSRAFRGTAKECAVCHADVHKGGFDRPGRPRIVDGKSGCVRCHDTSAFAPVARAFDHTLWTGYELTGAHSAADCTACHPRAAGGTATARRLGPALGRQCSSCHTDPHLGQFERAGATDCSRCHETKAFQNIHFDHQQTRFPLDVIHRVVACARCHTSYDTQQGKVVRYKPLGTACGDCHKLGADGSVRK
jgi:hypothetical protein